MEPTIKKRKYNIRQKKFSFNNTYDDNQLKEWFEKINKILNKYIPVEQIIYNIAILSTGSIIKCPGSLGNDCNGNIHFLKSDNFNETTDINIYTYTCDNNCGIDWNVFICDADDCEEKWICEKNTTLKGVCLLTLKYKCDLAYCDRHRNDEDLGLQCIVCPNYICITCSFSIGNRCESCQDYYCIDHYTDDTEYFSCIKCISNSDFSIFKR